MTAVGRPRLHLREVDSTNARAKELALAGAPHGTLVTAEAQTAGRGRQGREWAARPGSAVLMSLVLRELDELAPLRAAVAVCDALPEVRCAIKWPNDVWIDERKVAGILVEGRPSEGWAVLGIGLNVTAMELPEELRGIATSLALAGVQASVEDVLDALLGSLGGWLGASAPEVLDAWRPRDALRGRLVRWDGGEGTAAGINGTGALLVKTAAGEVALDAGEVHLRR